MKIKRLGSLLILAALGAGCATAESSRAARVEFEDIPIPAALTYLEDRAVVIESPGVKAARLLYRGRISPATLSPALRSGLEANGWRNVTSTTTSSQGTIQIYEKDRSALQLRVWEDLFFTYVELTTSRLAPTSASIPAASIPATTK